MEELVRFFEHRQTVMDRVAGGKAGAFEAEAGKCRCLPCGFGRNGQYLGRLLEQEGITYIALDLDPERVREAAAAGETVVFGDAAKRETLMAAGIARASVVVITYADTDAVADCDTDTNAGSYTANCICDTGAATS